MPAASQAKEREPRPISQSAAKSTAVSAAASGWQGNVSGKAYQAEMASQKKRKKASNSVKKSKKKSMSKTTSISICKAKTKTASSNSASVLVARQNEIVAGANEALAVVRSKVL
jgi:hypothetical protein